MCVRLLERLWACASVLAEIEKQKKGLMLGAQEGKGNIRGDIILTVLSLSVH